VLLEAVASTSRLLRGWELSELVIVAVPLSVAATRLVDAAFIAALPEGALV